MTFFKIGKTFKLTKKFKDQYEKTYGIRPDHGEMSSDEDWERYMDFMNRLVEAVTSE